MTQHIPPVGQDSYIIQR